MRSPDRALTIKSATFLITFQFRRNTYKEEEEDEGKRKENHTAQHSIAHNRTENSMKLKPIQSINKFIQPLLRLNKIETN